jgi:D-alanyl-D-alanine carboxypeptidase/D-alanyl-D-alanine-endopeptidase (penicillin-binding protein 4)
MKIITSAAALLYLGTEYNFITSLYYKGNIRDSLLEGDIYLVGGLDPDFSLKDLDSLTFLIKHFGINKITGNIYADVSMMDSIFWGNGWMWDDDPSTDFPYLNPLVINDNAITVVVEPQNYSKSLNVRIIPETKFVNIIITASISDSLQTNIDITRNYLRRTNDIIISGTINSNTKQVIQKLNIYNPTFYFLTLLKENLNNKGITVNGRIDTAVVPLDAILLTTMSRAFGDIIINLNKSSDNLSAEMTLLALGKEYFGLPATSEKGIRIIDSLLKKCGLKPSNYRIVDGSGISHYNLVSPELLLSILKYFYNQFPELFEVLKKSFPIAGIDGTLRNRMKNTLAENNVHAKTGTLSGVSCLSGYLTAKNGDEIAFSIMMQNHVRNTARAVEFQNKICEILSQ